MLFEAIVTFRVVIYGCHSWEGSHWRGLHRHASPDLTGKQQGKNSEGDQCICAGRI